MFMNPKKLDMKPVETPTSPMVSVDAAKPRPPTTVRPARVMFPAK